VPGISQSSGISILLKVLTEYQLPNGSMYFTQSDNGNQLAGCGGMWREIAGYGGIGI